MHLITDSVNFANNLNCLQSDEMFLQKTAKIGANYSKKTRVSAFLDHPVFLPILFH